MLSKSTLAGASILALAIGITQAHAQTPTIVWGGGGTSSAKVYRDIFNCYSTLADGIYATTPGNPTTVAYPVGPSAGCSTQGTASVIVTYESVGSTDGLAAFTTANPAGFSVPSATNTIAYLDSTFGIDTAPYPEIQFATSDVYLTTTQASQAVSAAGEPIFQLPAIVEPITLSVGNKQNVKLTIPEVCALFSGSIKTVGKITFSELVVRSDGSGASYIFSDFLAQNCPANLNFNATYGFPSTKPNWQGVVTLNGGALPVQPESGAAGVADQIIAVQNSIGYVTPDYVYPVVPNSIAYPAYVNGYLPTVVNANKNLLKATYPKTYDAATIGQQINDQLVAPGVPGYPIIGFSFYDVYQCYSENFGGGFLGTPAQGKALRTALALFFPPTAITSAIVKGQGFLPAPLAVTTLLRSTGGPFNATGGLQNSKCPKK